jgi:DNA (cytosine-5)-methyltransferase 1
MADLGYGVAWRVLDAQYFGVPQRRRRVFIVGQRDPNSTSAGEVLFNSQGSRGRSSQKQSSQQETAGHIAESI